MSGAWVIVHRKTGLLWSNHFGWCNWGFDSYPWPDEGVLPVNGHWAQVVMIAE